MIALLCSLAPATAQTVPNGDFEGAGLGPWTDESSDDWISDNGSAGRVDEQTAGIGPFPSPTHALELTPGDNALSTWGAAESGTFVATRRGLGWSQYSTDENSPSVRVIDASTDQVLADVELSWSNNTWSHQSLDISAACARPVVVYVRTAPPLLNGGWGWAIPSVYWDAFELVGDPCPQFVDDDEDGYCPGGRDTDGDGDCADPGEPHPDDNDCDDTNPDINPDAFDIPNNGTDEDCDGRDAGGTGTGTGSMGTGTGATGSGTGATGTGTTGSGTGMTGSGTGMTGSGTGMTGSGTGATGSGTGMTGTGAMTGSGTGASSGSGTGATTGSGSSGPGPGPGTGATGAGTGTGSDGTGTGTTVGLDSGVPLSETERLRASSGCGCTTVGSPVGAALWLVLLAVPLSRRREPAS